MSVRGHPSLSVGECHASRSGVGTFGAASGLVAQSGGISEAVDDATLPERCLQSNREFPNNPNARPRPSHDGLSTPRENLNLLAPLAGPRDRARVALGGP